MSQQGGLKYLLLDKFSVKTWINNKAEIFANANHIYGFIRTKCRVCALLFVGAKKKCDTKAFGGDSGGLLTMWDVCLTR